MLEIGWLSFVKQLIQYCVGKFMVVVVLPVIGHGILAGNYLTEYRDSLK